VKILRILKEANPYSELFITNGLAMILKYNLIPFHIVQTKSMYAIEITDDISYELLTFPELTLEDGEVLNSMVNLKEKQNKIAKINEFFNSEKVMTSIFSYYETLDESYLKVFKHTGSTYIGTNFYGRGIRAGTSPKSYSVKESEAMLSFIGFIASTVLLASNNEANAFLVPKDTHHLLRPVMRLRKQDAQLRYFFGAKAQLLINADVYTNVLYHLQSESIMNHFDEVRFMQVSASGQKPLPDINTHVKIIPASIPLIKKWNELLTWSIISEDVQYALAHYLLDQTKITFSRLVQTLSKKNILIENTIWKDWSPLLPSKTQEIYQHPTILKMGKGLKFLQYKKKGYPIQAQLLVCRDVNGLLKAVRDIHLVYGRVNGYPLMKVEEMRDFLDFVLENESDANSIADAILLFGCVLYDKKKVDELEVNAIEEETEEENKYMEVI